MERIQRSGETAAAQLLVAMIPARHGQPDFETDIRVRRGPNRSRDAAMGWQRGRGYRPGFIERACRNGLRGGNGDVGQLH